MSRLRRTSQTSTSNQGAVPVFDEAALRRRTEAVVGEIRHGALEEDAAGATTGDRLLELQQLQRAHLGRHAVVRNVLEAVHLSA